MVLRGSIRELNAALLFRLLMGIYDSEEARGV